MVRQNTFALTTYYREGSPASGMPLAVMRRACILASMPPSPLSAKAALYGGRVEAMLPACRYNAVSPARWRCARLLI